MPDGKLNFNTAYIWRFIFLFRENLKALRNQSQSLVTKVQFQLDNNRDSDIRQLSLRTETQPSVTDIALWTETLYSLMNEDFESRLLLFATWTPSNAKKVLDFCTQWSADTDIAAFTTGKTL